MHTRKLCYKKSSAKELLNLKNASRGFVFHLTRKEIFNHFCNIMSAGKIQLVIVLSR